MSFIFGNLLQNMPPALTGFLYITLLFFVISSCYNWNIIVAEREKEDLINYVDGKRKYD